jgi:hypothetical protein
MVLLPLYVDGSLEPSVPDSARQLSRHQLHSASGIPITGTTAPSTTLTCPNTIVNNAVASVLWPIELLKPPNALSPRSHPHHRRCPVPSPNRDPRPLSRPAVQSTTTRQALPIAVTGSSPKPTTRRAHEGTIGPSFPNDVDEAAGGHI